MRTTKNFRLGITAGRDEAQSSTIIEIAAAIGSFLSDPPDTAFQRGYLHGLKEILLIKLQAELPISTTTKAA